MPRRRQTAPIRHTTVQISLKRYKIKGELQTLWTFFIGKLCTMRKTLLAGSSVGLIFVRFGFKFQLGQIGGDNYSISSNQQHRVVLSFRAHGSEPLQ